MKSCKFWSRTVVSQKLQMRFTPSVVDYRQLQAYVVVNKNKGQHISGQDKLKMAKSVSLLYKKRKRQREKHSKVLTPPYIKRDKGEAMICGFVGKS